MRLTAKTNDAPFVVSFVAVTAFIAVLIALVIYTHSFIVASFGAFVLIPWTKMFVDLVTPKELELVLDEQCIRWGPTTGNQKALSRHSVRRLNFWGKIDPHMATAWLRNGGQEQLPTWIIGTDPSEFAHAVAKLWPDVVVQLEWDLISDGKTYGPGRAN
jgi:hypothetical protein